MPTKLKHISVYVTDEQMRIIERAAAMERRSMSNFLLAEGLARAAELGLTKAPTPRVGRLKIERPEE